MKSSQDSSCSLNTTVCKLQVIESPGYDYGNLTRTDPNTHDDETLKNTGRVLIVYVLPFIILLGTVGNVLSFAVMVRKRMRSTSVYFYLMCLSCADSLVLYISGFKTWIRVLTGFEMLHVSNAGCKFFMFVLLVSLHLSAWIIVLVTFDRAVVVWYPFRAQVICTARFSRAAILTLSLVTIATNLHVFWTIHLYGPSRTALLCAPHTHHSFMLGPYEYIKLVSYSVLPFTIVLLINVSIIIKLTKTSSNRTRYDTRTAESHNQQRVTCMLLIITFTWLLLTGPFTLHYLIAREADFPKNTSAKFLLKTICFLLMYINHSVNFLLYCIWGKKFRLELRRMLSSWKLCVVSDDDCVASRLFTISQQCTSTENDDRAQGDESYV